MLPQLNTALSPTRSIPASIIETLMHWETVPMVSIGVAKEYLQALFNYPVELLEVARSDSGNFWIVYVENTPARVRDETKLIVIGQCADTTWKGRVFQTKLGFAWQQFKVAFRESELVVIHENLSL